MITKMTGNLLQQTHKRHEQSETRSSSESTANTSAKKQTFIHAWTYIEIQIRKKGRVWQC